MLTEIKRTEDGTMRSLKLIPESSEDCDYLSTLLDDWKPEAVPVSIPEEPGSSADGGDWTQAGDGTDYPVIVPAPEPEPTPETPAEPVYTEQQ
jgi:hypothetical protein